MKRTFPQLFTLAANNTAQPLVYTKTSAIVGPNPLNNQLPVTVPVATSAIFQLQDKVVLDPGNSASEIATVIAFPSATSISVALLNAHASGVFVGLAVPIGALYVQEAGGNSGPITLGNSANMNTTAWTIAVLQNVSNSTQPYDWTDSEIGSGINPLNTLEYWSYGTAGDSYRVTLTKI